MHIGASPKEVLFLGLDFVPYVIGLKIVPVVPILELFFCVP